MSLYWKNMLLLKAMRRLAPFGNYPMPLRIRNKTYWFNDSAKSNTREIVLSELEGKDKFYQLPEDIPDGAIVFDIGAHVGIFSLPLAKEYPNARFICVEPNQRNYNNLWKNRERLKLTNVVLINAGIWDSNTKLVSIMDRANTGGSRTYEIPKLETGVNGFTLKQLIDLFSPNPKQKIWLLKMDCEGAEFKAIKVMHDVKPFERFIGEIHAQKADTFPDEFRTINAIRSIPKYRYVYLDNVKKTDYRNW